MTRSYSQTLIKASEDFETDTLPVLSGRTGWSCPSNIAIIKYWGKRPEQIPMNPSLSMTLEKAQTGTRVDYTIDPAMNQPGMQFFFEGRESEKFKSRISKFLTDVEQYLPWLGKADLTIHSENTFPHSSGIASSASAMGALALCLCEIDEMTREVNYSQSFTEEFYRKASFIARLGSGSAARSTYGNLVLWGKSDQWKGSSDEFAIPVTGIHPGLDDICDTILIVESGSKKVSSSAGHALMDNNPFASARFLQARTNLERLRSVILSGDHNEFIEIMENEALSLHAMMMTGHPGYLLIQPGTVSIIDRIRTFRNDTGLHAGFTLDAGANVHLLYPGDESEAIENFIATDLAGYCENGFYIRDRMGRGPQKLQE